MSDNEREVETKLNRSRGLKGIDPPIFWISIIISAILIIWGAVATEHFSGIIDSVFDFLVGSFGWLYIFFVAVVLLITVIIGFSRLGNIRLGKPGEEPEFSTRSWISMLFSAGMGIGLVFWGVAEPIMHYASPPTEIFGMGAETAESAVWAGSISFFHWALHPWALYAFFGLVLAYFGFRRGMPQLPSSTLYPILGKKGVNGVAGKVFNILAVFATLFGIATSLGLGAQQINSGLGELIGLPVNNIMATVIVILVTIAFIISAATGIEKGIKILSNINMAIGGTILILMIILGPTIFILNFIMESLGVYLQNFFELTFITSAVEQSPWPGWWTIFYWAWWISWTPFVGGFIARISRGRTIREFVIGVLIVPSIIGIIWIGTMGGSAIWLEQFAQGGIIDPVMADMASAFFVTLAEFPLGGLMSVLATILIATFFITSADSGTFVMGMLTSKGELEPSTGVKVTWGVFEGSVAAVLLLAGGLNALQTAAIAGAFPFMLFMIFTVLGILKALNDDYKLQEQGEFIGTIDLD